MTSQGDTTGKTADGQTSIANSADGFSPNMNLSVGLPKFNGEAGSFERFVEDFNIFARLQRWDDAKKCDIFPLCLSRIARDVMRMMLSPPLRKMRSI